MKGYISVRPNCPTFFENGISKRTVAIKKKIDMEIVVGKLLVY
ncbi:hypothetical protein [Flagellimonas olearia]|nr:hypothetical protein [Allomuricauda olearia]